MASRRSAALHHDLSPVRRPCAAALSLCLLAALSPTAHAGPPQPPAPAQAPPQGTPAPAPAGKHCLDRPDRRILLDHSLLGNVNPLGLDHRLRLYICLPLIRKPGLFFDYTNARFGVFANLSPTQLLAGGFAEIWPLSVLVLRAELAGVAIWPIPLPGAGYIALDDYQPFNAEILDPPLEGPRAATSATGFRTKLGATLQGRTALGKHLTLIALSVFAADYWRVGAGPFYYNTRMDAVMRTSDWIVLDTSLLILGFPFRNNYEFRLGAVNDLVYVPAAGYLGNAVYGMVAFYADRLGSRANRFNLFAWMGSYTNHGFRVGTFTLTAGMEVTWDIYRIAPKAAPGAAAQNRRAQ
jgi:hypothetical protein